MDKACGRLMKSSFFALLRVVEFRSKGEIMIKKTLFFGSLFLAAAAVPAPVFGAETAQTEVSFNLGAVTEYSFRGLAQSDEHPAIQGGADIAHSSGWHAGLWGSTVDFNDGQEAKVEVDVYGGYKNTFNGIDYGVQATYYAYPGANNSLNYDFYELGLSAGHDFGVFSATASFAYSPEFFGRSGHAEYYALDVEAPLPYDFSLSGHIGRQAIENNTAFGYADYTDWSLGLGYDFKGFDLSLKYVDTSLQEPGQCADGCAERLIFGVSKSF